MRHTGTAQMIAYPDEVMRVRAWIADGAVEIAPGALVVCARREGGER